MRTSSAASLRRRLDRTVRILCPLVAERIATRSATEWSEYDLRRELVGCILGSQVRHEAAFAATARLADDGLLDDEWWQDKPRPQFELRVLAVLSGRQPDRLNSGRYRFPCVRSKQLSRVRDALARAPLSGRLAAGTHAKALRLGLIADLAGLGPKQASMFLRNTGTTYNLAILDSHVLRFIDIQRLARGTVASVSNIPGYERTEQIMVRYADSIGYPAGYLDVAIWATMRAAQEVNQ